MSDALTGLEHFKTLFNRLNSENTGSLKALYHSDVLFQDPFVCIEGLESLDTYLAGAYSNVIHCRFDYGQPVVNGDRIALPWIMHLKHKKLRSGKSLEVEGISQLQFDGQKVVYHRDFFDAGQLLYENVPLVGRIIRWLKRHAA